MVTPLKNYTLFLSSEGDSVEIAHSDHDAAPLPEQAQALACKTHEQVLAFLEMLMNSETRNHLNFYHVDNTSYDAHMGAWPKGAAHACSLETQIDFVRYKIGEATHGIRHTPLTTPFTACFIQ